MALFFKKKKQSTVSFDDDLEEDEEEEEENKTNGEKPENGHAVNSNENDAEELGEDKNDNKDDDDIEIPDKVEEIGTALPPGGKHYKTQFKAPGHGTHTFSIIISSDCWVDADFEQSVKVKVLLYCEAKHIHMYMFTIIISPFFGQRPT